MKKKCPRCKGVLGLRTVGSLFDPTGEKYSAYWACKSCGWYSVDKFVDVSKVKPIVLENLLSNLGK